MNYNFYFGLYTILMMLFSIYGIMKYKTILNILTISIVMFSISILIEVPYLMLIESSAPVEYIKYTIILSIVYLVGYSMPFFLKTNFVIKIYHKFIVYFKLDNSKREMKYKKVVFFSFLLFSFLLFIILMIHSGGGLQWITNSREAYMDYRRGSGQFYAMTRWMLVMTFIFYLYWKRPKKHALISLFIFSFLAYFLGSKGYILDFWIIFIFYWHYLVKPIKNIFIIMGGLFIFILFLSIQLIQGTASNWADTIKYFIYFESTARFLSIFDHVGFQYGNAFIGQFWDMVPRSIYPDKPIVYGQYIIHETLNPGLLEKGRAVGTLAWTKYYLDFGILGVFISSVLNGIINKTTFQYFLIHKSNPFALIIMIQFGIIMIFNYTTTFVFFVLMLVYSKYFRLFGAFNKRGYMLGGKFNV